MWDKLVFNKITERFGMNSFHGIREKVSLLPHLRGLKQGVFAQTIYDMYAAHSVLDSLENAVKSEFVKKQRTEKSCQAVLT
ncbi:hypothetical protein CMV_030019 [Castanea mollissima]|uniref:Uncharacterized protein n=1 Tax=Castanea mollissima TaxID=60419 RepID=A0A8J4VAB2_9ROSI|nr:hypothetical protein CMV_030019 [Castanea mollissima]